MAQQRFGSHMPALRFLFFGLTILFAAVAPCPVSANAGFDGALRWRNVGPFRGGRTRAIAGIPSQPNVFYMAQVNGGVFKTIDYGRTWEPIFDDQPTGSVGAIAVSVSNPEIVYAGSGEGLHRPDLSIGDGIYKSTDAGKTWTHLGLRDGQQVAQLAVDPRNPDRFFVAVAGHPYGPNEERGIFRSLDGGQTFEKVLYRDENTGGGDVQIDPTNSDVVYATLWESREGPWENSTWNGTNGGIFKSIDGGKTWEGWRGAPGGDDYQNIWINPDNSNIILLGSDQGAIITVNGGQSWSSWYNQPTAQLYHVSADNAFPYRLYSGQQESGSVGIASRGIDGAITFRDWHPVAAEEYGYVVADPLDPDIIYGGKLTRYDRRTGQAQGILPVPLRSPDFRMIRTQPVVFSPVDPHLLFFSGNNLWQTRDGGRNWQQISPDLTRKTYELPASIGKYRADPTAAAKQRGVIYTVAPSPLDVNRIWCGTDDGLIHLTTNGGKTWNDVTPPAISAWQKISIIDASHFDPNAAYAAVNTLRLDDIRPHVYRTHDGGKTWAEIVHGISEGQTVNVVREDTQRKGLLFAGTERSVYVSLDGGDNWEPLRLNMPATSIRDLVIKEDDLAVATHGRGFWILDNITPLRQLTKDQRNTVLFKPQTALHIRWSLNTDTPLPPDEPAGENPPDGAMIDYFLTEEPTVTLEMKDNKGNLVRRYSSTDAPVLPDSKKLRIPDYWIRPPRSLSAQRGSHRFLWDMHYAPLPGIEPVYPMSAVNRATPPSPTSPWVVPAEYTVVLTVGGKSYLQPLTVKMDPRVTMSQAALEQQLTLSQQLCDVRAGIEPIGKIFDSLVEQLTKLREQSLPKNVEEKLNALNSKLKELGPPNPRPGATPSLHALDSAKDLFQQIQGVDAAPTDRVKAAVNDVRSLATDLTKRWKEIVAQEVPALDQELQAAGLPRLRLAK